MSDEYIYSTSSGTLKIPEVSAHTEKSRFNKDWGPRSVIKWSPQLRNSLLAFFLKCDYPFRRIEILPFDRDLNSEIRRFFISLDAYIESPNPVVPYKDILYGAADKEFSTYLKRVKRKSFEQTWKVEHFEFPSWWDKIPSYRINDIGDIFNYAYLIHFESESNDFEYGFIPVCIKQDTLTKFKLSLMEILPNRDSFEKIDKLNVQINLSSSMSFNSKDKKTYPHYKIKTKNLDFSKSIGLVKRAVINVSPENVRDTVLLDPKALNTLSLLDQQVMEVLREIPGHIHIRDKDRVSKRLKSLSKKCTLFIERDFRKEGITKPRQLLKAMIEVLNLEYPDIEIFGFTNFYDDFKILNNDEVIIPDRGHGLGMANSLTTLMQLTIHNMIIDELENDIPSIYAKLLCINDDFTVGFNDRYHLDSYWDKEHDILEDLSLIRAPEKSFVSEHSFVLAERYFVRESEYKKTSYQIREILMPFACFNISHAKSYFNATSCYVDNELATSYIKEIVEYWGYEFFPHEHLLPYIFGGWMTDKYESVDMSLKVIEQHGFKSYILRAFNAMKKNVYKSHKGMMFESPYMILLGFPKIPEEFWDVFDFSPIGLIEEKYGKNLSRSFNVFSKHWSKIFNIRQSEFKKDSDMTFDDFLENVIKTYSNKQFFPCEHMINKYHKWEYINIKLSNDPYLDPNPRSSLLAKYTTYDYPFKEEFSINFTNRDIQKYKEISMYSKEAQRTLKNEYISQFFTEGKVNLMWPTDGYDPNEDYINPIRIGMINSQIYWGKGYPSLKPKFRHPLIEKKREVFNTFLSIDDLIAFDFLKNRELLKECLRICKKYDAEVLKSLNNLIDEKFNQNLENNIIPNDEDTLSIEDYVYNTSIYDIIKDKDSSLFWNWRQDASQYPDLDDITLRTFNEMSNVIFQITFEGLNTYEEKIQLIEQLERNPIVRLLKGIVDLRSLAEPTVSLLDESDGDPFGALFGDYG
jgi:hypothetical protein